MGKLRTNEVGGVKMKKKGEKTFYSLKNKIKLLLFFWLLIWLYI
jgi:hypothetical protein